MTTKPTRDQEQPAVEPADVPGERDVDGHLLAQTGFHRQIATSRVREPAEYERPGQTRKATKGQSRGRSGRDGR
jgi:hypothetical protein